jgi:hypothetical protein
MDENQRAMLIALLQDPRAMQSLGMIHNPTERQSLGDSANNADMFGMNSITRLFGGEITPNTRVSEDFGAIQAMRRRR